MSRGAQAQTRQLTDQQLANINALNQQFLGAQQQAGSVLLPQYQNIVNNPGLSAADKAVITGATQGSLASAFGSLQRAAQNRVARTRNAAGFGELEDELARQKGVPPPPTQNPRLQGKPMSQRELRTRHLEPGHKYGRHRASTTRNGWSASRYPQPRQAAQNSS